jgi:hypothetical protein
LTIKKQNILSENCRGNWMCSTGQETNGDKNTAPEKSDGREFQISLQAAS